MRPHSVPHRSGGIRMEETSGMTAYKQKLSFIGVGAPASCLGLASRGRPEDSMVVVVSVALCHCRAPHSEGFIAARGVRGGSCRREGRNGRGAQARGAKRQWRIAQAMDA